jgi:hypothetical protein
MRSIAGSIVLSTLFAVVGGLLWVAARSEEQLAAAEHTLVTLRYERAAEELDAATSAGVLDPVVRRLSRVGADEPRIARYWVGDDDALSGLEEPALQLLAADAEYRAIRRTGGAWQPFVARLDALAKRYADLVRADPTSEDAAYNYEFIIRLRAAAVMARQPIPPMDPDVALVTPHGVAGAPPETTDAKKFKMIVPMLPDERQEAEEAGRAGRRVRKG